MIVTRRESTSLRILYVSRENAPGDHGGAVHTWQVASLLAGLGHQVCLLCHRRPGEPRKEARDGVAIRRANMALRGRSLPLLALPSLAAYRRSRFDVAMERFDTFGGLASIYARLTSTPPTRTGFRWATGVRVPVRPTCATMFSTTVVAWRGLNL